jgi:TonB family protein
MRARVQGSVTLTAVIEADGSVGPVRVAHSLDQELDAKAIEAAKQWLFSPATLNGTAVPVLITIDLSFRLSDTPASEFVFSWPDAFPAAPVTVPNEDSWTVDVEHADNLEVRVARPSDWIAFPQADHVDRISANHRILLSVGKPRAFPRSIDRPMERAQLLALGQMIAQQTRTGATSLAAAGQVQTPSGLWVWFELPTTIEDSELRRALGGVPQVYDGMTQWAFAGTLGGHLVQVGCGVMREHGRTDGQFMQDKRDAGLLCERIMQRMTITTK